MPDAATVEMQIEHLALPTPGKALAAHAGGLRLCIQVQP